MSTSERVESVDCGVRIEDVDCGVRIELRDVRFKYATRNVWVLKGVNITVEKE
jgi:ATP-binding cassette, subfamily B (MDR/TAP), member 1